VKFTPGAIANRVFGGIIQEMQLFPAQKVAIVIFLHPSEANAFVRHVKNVRKSGRAEEIRALQIEAGWYKYAYHSFSSLFFPFLSLLVLNFKVSNHTILATKKENRDIENPHSILHIQPIILTHHIASNATRCLRLHHLSTTKTKEGVSSELGRRLAMPLLTVILCPPKLDAFRSGRDGQSVRDARLDSDAPLGSEARLGRQAIVEFASISDAIKARELLAESEIDEYEDCEPVFASDPCAQPETERSYCSCEGCRYQRTLKGTTEVENPRGRE
jgi:hypothetical protein